MPKTPRNNGLGWMDKFHALEKGVRELTQGLRNFSEFVHGGFEQMGTAIYSTSVLQAAIVEHLGPGASSSIEAIVKRMEKERADKDEAEKVERERKAAELSAEKAAENGDGRDSTN